MKKILVQVDSDSRVSTFDQVVAYDSGVDNIISYGGIDESEIQNIVYGCIFTRGLDEMHNTALCIGGSDVAKGEKCMDAALKTFFAGFKISVMLDSNGCNTTSAAAVLKIGKSIDLKGKKAVVLGAGPVGSRGALHFANEGCNVTLTDITMELAKKSVDQLEQRFAVKGITPAASNGKDAVLAVLEGADIVLAAGPPKVRLLTEDMWAGHPTLKVLADINAVDPSGIEGIKPNDDGKERNGKIVFGALGIGGFKMKLQYKALAELFTSNDKLLNAPNMYNLGKDL
jgi:hypothetical protein